MTDSNKRLLGGAAAVALVASAGGFLTARLTAPAAPTPAAEAPAEAGKAASDTIAMTDAAISIRNQLRATVTALGPVQDGTVEVGLDVAGEPLRARITAASAASMGLRPGLPVLALVKSVALGPDAAIPER